MTTRVANLAASNQLVNVVLRTQSKVHDAEMRVSTTLASQDYIGIADRSERLINMENQRTLLDSYNRNNDAATLRLDSVVTTLDGIEQTIRNFRSDLDNFAQSQTTDEAAIASIQQSAVRSMKAMEAYLNTTVDGRFLFSGSRVTTEPVTFSFATLSDFQALYDGSAVTYPTTRDTAIHPKLKAATGFPSDPTAQGYTTLSFTDATNTITAANAGAFGNLPVGSTITITGTTGGTYDGTYTISSNDGTNIVVSEGLSAGNLAGQAAVTITADTSYYSGDEQSLTQRVDQNRSFAFDLNAVDPAFEKAIRAMGIIAQGVYGTAGGLDQNLGRVDQAKFLINASLYPTVSGTPPFGTEAAGNVEDVQQELGFQQVLMHQANTFHSNLINFLDQRSSDIENVDPLESITQLTNDSRVLEASYQALARIRELGLQDFLK